MSFVISDQFILALVKAGIVPPATTKVIIEAEVGRATEIHYSVLAEDNLLEVLPAACQGAVVRTSLWEKLGRTVLWRKENEDGDRETD